MPDANMTLDRTVLPGLDFPASNPRPRDPLSSVIGRRSSRRAAVQGLLGAGAVLALGGEARAAPSRPLPVPPELPARSLVGWGDALFPNAPAFDPEAPDAASAAARFGRDPGELDLLLLPPAPDGAARALLVAHHGVAAPERVFPARAGEPAAATPARAEALLAAQGVSVVELRRGPDGWRAAADGSLNRRITGDSAIPLAGPAAGHRRLRTAADPRGVLVRGTLGNRACGVTPWNTALSGEADFSRFLGAPSAAAAGRGGAFARATEALSPSRRALPARGRRDGVGRGVLLPWTGLLDRFDAAREPGEADRFGWMVELDLLDPGAPPVKRTALGRFAHNGCVHAAAPDGRAVLYMTDAGRDEYLYRFVSARPAGAADALDEGVLSAARFDDGGGVEWLPLVHGQGPLVPANGFRDQGEVLVDARRAADLLEPTPIARAGALRAARNGVLLVLAGTGARPGRPGTADAVLLLAPPALRNGDLATMRLDHAAPEARWEMLPGPVPPRELRLPEANDAHGVLAARAAAGEVSLRPAAATPARPGGAAA